MTATSAGLSYMPQPFEQAYYSGLFNFADVERRGSIGGAHAVQFFSRSKLPVEILKSIWSAADTPSTNSLDHRKFAIAVRLVQLAQNGQKGQGMNLAAPAGVTLRPAFFDGVSGVSVQMPQHQPSPSEAQQSQPSHQGPQQPQQQPTTLQQQLQQQQQRPMQPPSSPTPSMQRGMVTMQTPSSPTPSMRSGMVPQMAMQQPPLSPTLSVRSGMVPPPNARFQPTSPSRPPHPATSGGPTRPAIGPGALTVQDPYTLTPTEQARYDQLFPDYCKDDGYCYGPEAVALFGKSGLPQPQLASIWNMVDNPVDNRLDRLEFAMAMHLIVCVSKKNLPLPASLPMSLKQLKSQQTSSAPMNAMSFPSPQLSSTPNPPQLQPPPPMQQPFPQTSTSLTDGSMYGGSTAGTSMGASAINTQQQQPPIVQPPQLNRTFTDSSGFGGASVPGSVMNGGFAGGGTQNGASMQNFGGVMADGGMQTGMAGGGMGISGMQGPPPLQPSSLSISDAFEGLSRGDTVPTNSFRPATPPLTMSNSFDNMNSKINVPVLTMGNAPSPQTETASMPAPSVASIPSPKRDKTIRSGDSNHDMTELRAALQKLQAENISLKAKLGTMSGEEDEVRKELVSTVSEISKLSSNLTTLRAEVLSAKSRLLEVTGELAAAKEKKSVITDLIAEAQATKTAINEASESIEKANVVAHSATNIPAPAPDYETNLFDWGSSPAPAPAPIQNQGIPDPSASFDSFGGSNFAAGSFGHVETVGSAESQQSAQHQPKTPEPAASFSYNYSNPTALQPRSDNILDQSAGANFGEVMGGGSDVRSLAPADIDIQNVANASQDEVEDLKRQAKEASVALREAENVAATAAVNIKQVTAHAEELLKIADEAEQKSREMESLAQVKKKKMFGRSGPKYDAKEAEKLAVDAKEKKEAYLEVQSQVNDAKALANDTQKEVDRLRKAVEDLELKAASAASMEKQAPKPAPPVSNGYAGQTMSYGFGAPDSGGFGGQSYGMGGGYSANVMGGGGLSIPTPSGADDPYGNPF